MISSLIKGLVLSMSSEDYRAGKEFEKAGEQIKQQAQQFAGVGEKVQQYGQQLEKGQGPEWEAKQKGKADIQVEKYEVKKQPEQLVQRERATVVKETIVPKEVHEFQQIIHREREQTEIHEIVQPIKQVEERSPIIIEKQLPPLPQKESKLSQDQFLAQYKQIERENSASTETGEVTRYRVERPPIVMETIKKTVIEEYQPIIYKETIVPTIIKEKQPVYERIVEAPRIILERREVKEEEGVGKLELKPTKLKPSRSLDDLTAQKKKVSEEGHEKAEMPHGKEEKKPEKKEEAHEKAEVLHPGEGETAKRGEGGAQAEEPPKEGRAEVLHAVKKNTKKKKGKQTKGEKAEIVKPGEGEKAKRSGGGAQAEEPPKEGKAEVLQQQQ